MGKRPSVYVSFGDDETGITVDMRIHAPASADMSVVHNETFHCYIELVDKLQKKWSQRDSSTVQHRPHKPKITGSTPVPASTPAICHVLCRYEETGCHHEKCQTII